MTVRLYPNEIIQGHFIKYADFLKKEFSIKQHYKQGETIIGMADDRSKYCYYILSGTVIVLHIDRKGIVHTSSLRSEGTIFPLYYTYSSTATESTLEFSAFTDCEVLVLPKDRLYRVLKEKPNLAIAMMDAWCDYATYLTYRSEMQFETVEERVCSYLWLQNEQGLLRVTHQEIADAVGAARETVSRVLAQLRKQGTIEATRGKIRILSYKQLEEHIMSDLTWGAV